MIEGAIATSESGRIGLDELPIALRGPYGEVLMPSVQANDTMRDVGKPLCAAHAREVRSEQAAGV